MQELIELLELNTTNEPLPHLIDVIKEVYIQKEKEQIINTFDYGYYCASNGTSAEITLDGKMNYNQTYSQNK